MKVLINIILVISTILLVPIGLDKFLNFIEPPCSVMHNFPPLVWKSLGVIQIIGAILLWIPKFRITTASFFLLFMLSFTIYHISQNTYDIGGSVFMVVLYTILIFLEKKTQNTQTNAK